MDWGLSRVGLALIGVESRETQQYETAPATSQSSPAWVQRLAEGPFWAQGPAFRHSSPGGCFLVLPGRQLSQVLGMLWRALLPSLTVTEHRPRHYMAE